MADITNPQAVKYVNEVVRPLCEEVRALKAKIDDAMVDWFAGLNNTIGNSSGDTLIDGRADQGISVLNGEDITGVMVVLAGLQTALNEAGVAARIDKPCVRPLQAD